jgi:phenylalanyl-tRNA synthetase beta chain
MGNRPQARGDASIVQLRPADTRLSPGKCAEVLAGERDWAFREYYVRSRFELGIRPSRQRIGSAKRAGRPREGRIVPVPAFPPVLRTSSSEGSPAGEVETQLRAAGGPLLSQVRLFDVFRGEQIGEGRKSLAYSLVYQARDRTLTDEEIAELRSAIVARLENALGAKLRG